MQGEPINQKLLVSEDGLYIDKVIRWNNNHGSQRLVNPTHH